jgi:hypothetical protein
MVGLLTRDTDVAKAGARILPVHRHHHGLILAMARQAGFLQQQITISRSRLLAINGRSRRMLA